MTHDDILSLVSLNPEPIYPWSTSYVRKYMVILFKPDRVNISIACIHQHPSSLLYTLNANVTPNKQFPSCIFLLCYSSAVLMLLSRKDDLFTVSLTYTNLFPTQLSVALFPRQFQAPEWSLNSIGVLTLRKTCAIHCSTGLHFGCMFSWLISLLLIYKYM